MTKTLDNQAIGVTIDEEDQDFMTESERKIYNRWRIRILSSIIIGYGAYYLCRQNFSMIMPAFINEFGYTRTQIGSILTIASIIYGVGKFMNGYISDRSNARYFMTAGLLISSIITFILGFSESLIFLGVFWSLNNWFQSMGWPPAARMLTHWYAPKELGTKWALGAASHQVGGALTLVFTGYLITEYGWRFAFFIPAMIAAIVALFLFNRLRESPKILGLPPVEAYKGDFTYNDSNIEEDHLSADEIIKKVFLNQKIWMIGLTNMCIYIVRIGIIFWAPLFLTEYKNVSLSSAGWQVAAHEVTGLLGGFCAGWLSDKIFNGERGFIGSLFMVALSMNLLAFWHIPDEYNSLRALLLVTAGFFVYGPQVLIGVASADFASKKAVGTANGFVGTMGYVGSGLSGVCVGAIVDNDALGWMGAFTFFTLAALIGAALFFATTFENKKKNN